MDPPRIPVGELGRNPVETPAATVYKDFVDYIDVEEARGIAGLRLVLTQGGPGPWSEAAKAILQYKGLAFISVRQSAGEPNDALQAWTGQSSAPVAVWNDDPPYTTSRSILWLAERLAPSSPLLPTDPEERVVCLGLCDEIHGTYGLGWCRRLTMFAPLMEALGEAAAQSPIGFMATKYGYSCEAAQAATMRMVEVLRDLDARLAKQQAAGSLYLVGTSLSAADIYWATFATMFAPLPPAACPMPEGLRQVYTVPEGPVAKALTPALLEHRDRIYREHLVLPLDF